MCVPRDIPRQPWLDIPCFEEGLTVLGVVLLYNMLPYALQQYNWIAFISLQARQSKDHSHITDSRHEDCSRSLWVWCHRQTLMDSVPLVLNSFNPRQLLTVQYYWSRMNTNCSSLSQRKKHTLSCFFWGWDPLKKRGYAPSRIPRISLPFSAALFDSVPRPPNHQRTPLLLSRMSRMTYSYSFNCWLAPAIAL